MEVAVDRLAVGLSKAPAMRPSRCQAMDRALIVASFGVMMSPNFSLTQSTASSFALRSIQVCAKRMTGWPIWRQLCGSKSAAPLMHLKAYAVDGALLALIVASFGVTMSPNFSLMQSTHSVR